jgi:hypothetical protein
MKSRTGLLPIALLLFVAAGVLWTAGARQTRVAEAQRALATLRYAQAAESLAPDSGGALGAAGGVVVDRMSALAGASNDSARAGGTGAAASYWSAHYDIVTVATGADPFLAANAAYRLAMRQGGDWREVTGRLDDVIARYADVLRRTPGHADAAYNYEFAIRHRAAIAARQQPVPPAAASAEADAKARANEMATPHGIAGAPPAEAETKSFKLIVPMRPEERQEAERAGKSGPRVRKG